MSPHRCSLESEGHPTKSPGLGGFTATSMLVCPGVAHSRVPELPFGRCDVRGGGGHAR